jgi:RNA polymerase sigma-70 factor (ECF subfamily)
MPRLTLVGSSPSSDASQDAAVVAALLRKEPGSERTAWLRLRPVVEGTLRRLMGPGNDVADLEQEVFLRFFRSVKLLRDPAALPGFVVGIAFRVVSREMRSRWLRRFFRLSTTGEPPETPTTPVDLESREVLRRYYRILDRIGGEGRSLFVARQIERLPMGEVATLHGLSMSTAQRRLRRVMRRVAAMVEADPVLAAYVACENGEAAE